MRDPYDVLGVARTATAKEIKAAFRKLAKQYHPDRNPNDPKAKEKFGDANQAYEILGDEKNKAAFDRGEIGPDGKPRFQGFDASGFAGGEDPFAAFRRAGGRGRATSGSPFGDGEDIFSQFFGGAFSQADGGVGARTRTRKGADISATLDVTIEELATAAKVTAIFPGGRKLAVKLPHFVEDGQTIRLKGQGEPGAGGAGDALIKINLRKDGRYRVDGRDLHVDLPVPLHSAVLGAKVPVETPTGRIAIAIPAWSSSDKVLRLKGKGLPVKSGGHADLLVHVRLMLPSAPDPDLEAFLRERG